MHAILDNLFNRKENKRKYIEKLFTIYMSILYMFHSLYQIKVYIFCSYSWRDKLLMLGISHFLGMFYIL